MATDKPNVKSPDYEAMAEFWQRVTDIVDGQDAIIEQGETYLPKLPNESQKDYEFRLETAKFTNVYRDILEGLAQRPFSHPLTVGEETDTRIRDLVEDIDGRGNHLHVFASDTFFEGINKAIDWVLVDFQNVEFDHITSVDDEKKAGVRPYWVHIPADKVIWVKSKVIQGREQLTLVRIQESENRIREYVREQFKDDDGNIAWRVVWAVYVENPKVRGTWDIEDNGVLSIDEIPMVPFATGRRKGKSWRFNPPMSDAADLQIELYQQESGLKHIKTMSAFPMFSGNGVQPDVGPDGKPKRVPIGPSAVLYAPPDADGGHGEWTSLSPDADLLRFLAEDVKSTILQLRELGRQPLTAQSGNLTVVTTMVAAEKGNSAVQEWALKLKDALESCFRLTALWLGVESPTMVTVFTDFGIEDLNDKTPEHLLKMRAAGDLSAERLWDEFKRRGILGADFTNEDEIKRLFSELPGGDEPEI